MTTTPHPGQEYLDAIEASEPERRRLLAEVEGRRKSRNLDRLRELAETRKAERDAERERAGEDDGEDQ